MNNGRDKIAEAIETCLPLVVGHSDQFGCVYGYVKSLRERGGWTEAELVDVQVQVIRALMKRPGAR